jgi:predicted NBD/HSP70 family sugar kinase
VDLALKRTTVKGVLSTVDDAIEYLLKNGNVPRERITTTVVGVPGIISPIDGEISEAGSLSTIEDVGFTSQLSDHLGLAVTVDNDVNLMALGERARGLGQGVDNFAVVSVGSGIGAGLVLGGKLHRGAHGGAGEVHLTPFHLLAKDASLFDPASDGLQTSAARIARKRRGTSLKAPYDPVQVFAAARNGDLAALEVVGAEARAIALYLLTIAAVVDVELVILAGGIGTNEDLLLAPIRQLLAEHHPIPPRVETSSLGRGAVLAGAIAVAQERARDLLFTTRLVQNRS